MIAPTLCQNIVQCMSIVGRRCSPSIHGRLRSDCQLGLRSIQLVSIIVGLMEHGFIEILMVATREKQWVNDDNTGRSGIRALVLGFRTIAFSSWSFVNTVETDT